LGGKVKGAAGDLTGEKRTQDEGNVTELKGSAQNLYGQAKDTLSEAAGQTREFAGDAFAKARERYPDAQRVYQRGNEALRPHVQESPLGLAILAGAIGYLFALVIHGRR
ncbi:CsbD family protein, partial [Methylobacterium sp. J-048]|uniref:CsbD family protein n=1 Tax=Methylobacterium sp. J-048 TaxID=2836635 RepID=UPI001FBBD87F